MLTLRDIVAAQTSASEELPLVHTTRCEMLPHIVGSNELRGGECDVFHEHLVYFFYGRPAYRHALGREPGGGIELCPVCFVFKPHTVSSRAKRVSACDSGGVHNGFFQPHLTPPDCDEILLDATIESACRLVPLIYGTNARYYTGQAHAVPPPEFAPGSVGARFHALLRETGALGADDRRSAIEVQMDSPVPLGHDLLYVVLPWELLNQPDVRRAILETWQCDPIGYDVYPGAPPHDYTATIRDTLRRRFEEGRRL